MISSTQEVREIWGEHSKLFTLYALLFAASIIGGWLSYSLYEEELPGIIQGLYRGVIIEDSSLATFVNIFWRNLEVTALMTASGIIIVGPAFILLSNGTIVGLVLRYGLLVKQVGWWVVVKAVAPHGIIEVPVFLFSAAVGTQIGLRILKGGDKSRLIIGWNSLRNAVFIYVQLIFPLVFIAALIESYLSFYLVS